MVQREGMKKQLIVLLVVLISATTVANAEKPSFRYSVGAELTSAYLWRGFYYGGLSFQPTAEVSYAGIALGAWASLGASDWNFDSDTYFYPELDVSLSYSIGGFTAMLTHYHFFDSPFFDFANGNSPEGEGNTNQTEAMLSYTISEAIPFTISWNTTLFGSDGYYVNGDATKLKRAYSTYIELSYDFSLPREISLKTIAGFSPWRGMYTYYEGDFAFNNLSVRLEREFALGEVGTLSAFAQPVFNLYDAGCFSYHTHFNWVVGVGVWF